MPRAQVNGEQIYYEETGSGVPLVLCHEFAGDLRAWEPQVRHFGRRYRVVSFNYRGYPPSGVPVADEAYAHGLLVEDLKGLLDALGIARAHIAGLATGGNLALNFALEYPDRVNGLVVAGAGAGTSDREAWLAAAERFADDIRRRGTAAIVDSISNAPQRLIFRRKDPRGWNDFVARMLELSPQGTEKMMRIALTQRAPITALGSQLRQLPMPILVLVGDQDHPADEASRYIREQAPHAGLAVLPMCGHTLNSEEPALFNQFVETFLAAVDGGRWGNWSASSEQGRP